MAASSEESIVSHWNSAKRYLMQPAYLLLIFLKKSHETSYMALKISEYYYIIEVRMTDSTVYPLYNINVPMDGKA